MKFKEIEPNFYNARLTDIKEESGRWGHYLRFIFTVADGELMGYRFSGFVKISPFKQGKLFHWVKNILGSEPAIFSPEDLIGKECTIYLSQKNDRFYSVTHVYTAGHDSYEYLQP